MAASSLSDFLATKRYYTHTNDPIKIAADTRPDQICEDLTQCEVDYPTSEGARASYRTADGKCITPHHWAVYDFVRTIPAGKVVTYKDVCIALGAGSPRSALRNNPFAPFVPCHRIIASTLFVGGFFGEWGQGSQVNRKLTMLNAEGVRFKPDGYLDGEKYRWKWNQV